MRLLRWLVILVLGAGVLALMAVMFWLPPNDPDSFALVRERTARLAAFRLKKPLPGTPLNSTAPLEQRLAQGGFRPGAPIFLRVYKLTFELEVWLQKSDSYALFATYPICYFSGQLGPKIRYGDWQSPEGFYQIEARHMNPFSAHHRAFNFGFPNAYDRAHGRTGSLLEVHGGCSSVGCYAITNNAIDDLYRLATAAFQVGQSSFQVQALPFRLTTEAMVAHTHHPQAFFWDELKAVADVFDETKRPPEIVVCGGHYRVARRTPVPAGTIDDGACRQL